MGDVLQMSRALNRIEDPAARKIVIMSKRERRRARGVKPNSAQLRELERQNALFPGHLVAIPRDQWPDMSQSPYQTGSVPLAVFRSRKFCVVVWQEPNGAARLSVQRTEYDRDTGRFRENISWDDLQRLKGEAGFADMCAVEIYPPDDQVVNVANMRHLFLLPTPPRFMWTDSA